MNLAKFFAAATFAALPLSLASAQATTASDSTSHGRAGWIAGTGAVAGAGLFLAFTHSAHDATGGSPSTAFAGSNSNGSNRPTGGLTPSPAGGSTPTAGSGDSTPPDTTATPPDTTTTPPGDPQPGPNDFYTPPPGNTGPFLPPSSDTPPHEYSSLVPASSTVPEPGTLALTATGIIGLLPLARRRRR